LRKFGEQDDYVMLVRNEILCSKEQKKKAQGFLASLTSSSVREIFAINNADLECSEAKATLIERTAFFPHHVIQHIDVNDPKFQKLKETQRITYHKQNEVYAV
jgi:hypothetical protein